MSMINIITIDMKIHHEWLENITNTTKYNIKIDEEIHRSKISKIHGIVFYDDRLDYLEYRASYIFLFKIS